MIKYVFWIIPLFLLLNACNSSGSGRGKIEFVSDSQDNSNAAEAFEVIYSLRLPMDISQLFEETGTGYNPDLPMPLDRIPLYDDPGQMAMLLGALGVDLSYCKLFERVLESAECYKHIELLANKLDLPKDIFKQKSDELELYVKKPDSLTSLINQVYSDVDSYFKEYNQVSLASLSLLGGWLETMYIGVQIYQENSVIEMGDRILQQKYALNSLTGLLANHQESLVVASYMHPLNRLRKEFEQVDIRYSREGFELNEEQQTFRASVSEINYESETLNQICQIIIRLREDMVY